MLIRCLKAIALGLMGLALASCRGGILDPKGQVGADEKTLIIVATVLMLLVVIPVIFMTLYFAWRYRASRSHEIYEPKWSHSNAIEVTIWLIPCVIIAILGTITWRTTHALDPYKKLDHHKEPLTVEVVSLNWKWLFIYPEQGIATVNQLVFPVDQPVHFKITSESTMNSFFIPQLGSQIYSMAGMETHLNLIADEAGTYDGFSANYSGAGFSGMKFDATATSDAEFSEWVSSVKASSDVLDAAAYSELAKPSEYHPVEHFASVSDGLFHQIMHRYMKNYNDWKQNSVDHEGEGSEHADHHSRTGQATADSAAATAEDA